MLEDVNSQSCVVIQRSTTYHSPNSPTRMEQRTLYLDKLPLEIIQHIISLGTCKAMLALRLVCRRLCHACCNPCVVRDIVKYSSGRCFVRGIVKRRPVKKAPICHSSTSTLAWYDSVLLSKDLLSISMRYALAREEFLPILKSLLKSCKKDSLADDLRLIPQRILSFLPQLIASHCERVPTEGN